MTARQQISMRSVGVTVAAIWLAAASAQAQTNPVITVETSKGSLAVEFFAREAPSTVAHVLALVRRGFYDGQRIHRAIPGFVVQFGDPQSRDVSKRALWGRGRGASSGTPIGVAEINVKRLHRRGSVAMAHPGLPSQADSQIYIALGARKDLDGQYAVVGQVIAGDEILDRFEIGDVITRVSEKP